MRITFLFADALLDYYDAKHTMNIQGGSLSETLNYVPDGGDFFLNTDAISYTRAGSSRKEINTSMERFFS